MSGESAHGGDGGGEYSLSRLITTTIVAILLAAGEEVFDPFGLDSQSDQLSADVFNTITSPFYGEADSVRLEGVDYPSRRGQSDIVVLLIDDDYLTSSGRTWPLNPRDYRGMLQKLVDADAAAVFVDIYFRQDNEQRSARIARLFADAEAMSEKAPIFFAGSLQDPVPTALGRAPPATALASMLVDNNIYKLRDTAIDGNDYDTAAWALYQAWCRQADECAADALASFTLQPMYLHWGYAPNRMLTDIPEFGAQVCRPQATTLWGRFWNSLRILGWNLVRGFQDARIAPCPYHTQIKVPLFNSLTQNELQQLVGGKVVLLGASLANFPDYYRSPMHDFIPGVFWHAMGVDNLMEFGVRYRKDPQDFASDNFEVIGIVLILSMHAFITYLIQVRGRGTGTRKLAEGDKLRLDLLHGLITISVIAATVLLFTGVRSWSPANWIGFAMLMLLIDFQPVTSLGQVCWRIYPIARLSKRSFSYWMYTALAAVTLLLAIVPAFLLFIVPHALLLGHYMDDVTGSYSWLAFYAVIIAASFVVIVRETSS